MKHIYVCWKAIYKYKAYLCNSNCKAILTLVSFNRAVVPLFELSFLTKSQKLTSA